MNRSKKLIGLVERAETTDREAELKKKPISELTDDELVYMVMFSDVLSTSAGHPYMVEAAKRGLMYEDEKRYAQLTKAGWKIWNKVKGSYGLSAGVQPYKEGVFTGTGIGPSLPVKIQDAKGTRLDAATKKKVSHEVSGLSSGKYYDEIPLQDVFDILKKYGIVALQEDNTEWDGFLTGREGQATLPLAPIASKSAEGFYTPYSNVGLHFSWYKMPSNRYEFIVYAN